MTALAFEDVHKHAASGYYIVPNEDTVEWRNLVKKLRINRAAAICSSGEVGLVALLPTVRKELVLIDHSYASLSVAMLKYVMLRELGATETKRLLSTAGSVADLKKNLGKFVNKLPKDVRLAYERYVNPAANSWEGGFVYVTPDRVTWNYKTHRYEPIKKEAPVTNPKLQHEWTRLPSRDLLRCATKLDRVKFLHGDLSDLAERGPFDLIYLSNALEHSGRKGAPTPTQVEACLRPGGYAIVAHRGDPTTPKVSYYTDYIGVTKKLQDAKWEVVKTSRTRINMGWSQTLYRVPERQEVAA